MTAGNLWAGSVSAMFITLNAAPNVALDPQSAFHKYCLAEVCWVRDRTIGSAATHHQNMLAIPSQGVPGRGHELRPSPPRLLWPHPALLPCQPKRANDPIPPEPHALGHLCLGFPPLVCPQPDNSLSSRPNRNSACSVKPSPTAPGGPLQFPTALGSHLSFRHGSPL